MSSGNYMSQLDQDNIEAEIWEMEQTVAQINKILKGEVDADKIEERQRQIEEKKKKEALLRQIKQREKEQQLLNGTKGKGEGKNYLKFCMNCFIEYNVDLINCTHCHKPLITQAERHANLKEKVEVLKEQKKKKKYRRMKYENWLKSQSMIHVDAARIGPTNYTKWDMYESESDEDEKEPILPRHDPQFQALEKQLNDDLKRREEAQRKCLRLKEEANQMMKNKKYRKAIKLYSDAIECVRGYFVLYTNRATAYMKIEEWQNAINDCTKVIEYYDLFEDEMAKNLDTYTKALIKKAYCDEKIRDYENAVECIEKLRGIEDDLSATSGVKGEINKLEELINSSKKIYEESLKAMKIENDPRIKIISSFITLLKEANRAGVEIDYAKLQNQFYLVYKIISDKTKKMGKDTTQDNEYILYLNISGGIEAIFNYLASDNNTDSKTLTKLLALLTAIVEIKKYMPLINNIRGFNKLILFLFVNDDSQKDPAITPKPPVTIEQANLILSLLESASLDDECRKTITDINQLDNLVDIVINKYNIAAIKDNKTAELLSKTFTFVSNICYSSNDIRKKISMKVAQSIFSQLNAFIDEYKFDVEYHRNLLSSVLSFVINLACDLDFRKALSQEKKFLKFLSETLLLELVNNELKLEKLTIGIDEMYEKISSLFYNITFIQNEEKSIIDFYCEIKLEAFLFFYINARYDPKDENTFLPLARSLQLLFRIVKFSPEIFSKSSPVPEKDVVVKNLVDFMNIDFAKSSNQSLNLVLEYVIKTFVFLIKAKIESLNEKGRISLLIKNCCKILFYDCGMDSKKINESNYTRVVNMLSLLGLICGEYKENGTDFKPIVQLLINVCKEKTELDRKNAAMLLAKIAKSCPEMEQYVRDLHGIDVLMNISKFLNI